MQAKRNIQMNNLEKVISKRQDMKLLKKTMNGLQINIERRMKKKQDLQFIMEYNIANLQR